MEPADGDAPDVPPLLISTGGARWPGVARQIVSAIQDGTYPPGKTLLVRDLARELGVNHGTMGRALQELIPLRYVERVSGRLRVAGALPPPAPPAPAAGAVPPARVPRDHPGPQPPQAASRLMTLLAAHGPLTTEQAARLDGAPGLDGAGGSRTPALARYGTGFRRLEHAGLAARAATAPGRNGKGTAVVWQLTGRGRARAAADITDSQLQTLILLAAHGPLTTDAAARLTRPPRSPAERLQALKQHSARLRALEDRQLAARAGREPNQDGGGPRTIWQATDHGARIAALAGSPGPGPGPVPRQPVPRPGPAHDAGREPPPGPGT